MKWNCSGTFPKHSATDLKRSVLIASSKIKSNLFANYFAKNLRLEAIDDTISEISQAWKWLPMPPLLDASLSDQMPVEKVCYYLNHLDSWLVFSTAALLTHKPHARRRDKNCIPMISIWYGIPISCHIDKW